MAKDITKAGRPRVWSDPRRVGLQLERADFEKIMLTKPKRESLNSFIVNTVLDRIYEIEAEQRRALQQDGR